MLFDGFTALAQVLNFIILVLLLKRFLYGPILRAMAERQQRIAEAMDQAKAAMKEARKRSEKLSGERQALAAAKNRLLAEAREEALKWRQNALEEVKREVDGMRRSWEEGLRQDREVFLSHLKVQVADQVMRISAKVLSDLADERLENRLVEVLMDRLSREKAGFSAHDLSGEVTVQCGFTLTASRKEALYGKIMAVFPTAKTVSIERNSEIGLGLRLVAGDKKLEWTLTHYLQELEQGVLTALLPSGREIE
ncbi:hypothetical protein [Desulfococcus sp.]|uniref:F0F1 ATP synthase subunit B family protein n=1 Tax=Desulfococcus sp. TaxID=2025834 RepID=UPI0035939B81